MTIGEQLTAPAQTFRVPKQTLRKYLRLIVGLPIAFVILGLLWMMYGPNDEKLSLVISLGGMAIAVVWFVGVTKRQLSHTVIVEGWSIRLQGKATIVGSVSGLHRFAGNRLSRWLYGPVWLLDDPQGTIGIFGSPLRYAIHPRHYENGEQLEQLLARLIAQQQESKIGSTD